MAAMASQLFDGLLAGPTPADLWDSIVVGVLQDARCAPSSPRSIRQLCSPQPSPELSAILATALISLAPMLVLPLLPPMESERGRRAQPLLLCFAAGGLLGDVFLHILPHSHAHEQHGGHSNTQAHGDERGHGLAHGHEHAHEHGHAHGHEHAGHAHSIGEAVVGMAVLAGFMAFFLVEKLVRHRHGGDAPAHAHAHSHGKEAPAHSAAQAGAGAVAQEATPRKKGQRGKTLTHDPPHSHSTPTATPAAHVDGPSHSHSHGADESHGATRREPHPSRARRSPARARPAAAAPREDAEPMRVPSSDGRIAGYLNLAADAAHNFTDGLALGAAFRSSWWVGVGTTLTVLIHEVPHEVGDVAILMQAGFSKWEAIRAQLSTALGALLGTLVALALGEQQSSLLLDFTAGGFIYVATVDVMPTLLRGDCSFAQTMQELFAMTAGVSMMLLVLALES
ncbi:hypothetical protein AB1Y20_014593 [Prymnesium parvum]|uniref:Uncharacterized protein n=1 Tax=Prymnesium parvum TaxID=97485 RepID=A0AB34IDR9_PRYPA